MYFSFVEAFFLLIRGRERLRQSTEPVVEAARLHGSLGQHTQKIRPVKLNHPARPRDPVLYPRNSLFMVSLSGDRPAAQSSRPGQPLGYPVLGAECQHGLRGLLRCTYFAAIAMNDRCKDQNPRRIAGIGQPFSQRPCLIAALDRPVGVAERP